MHVFDIFSKPFYFSVSKGQEKNKTNCGGLITLTILLASFTYFISILITFFQRGHPPTVNSSKFINSLPTQPVFLLENDGQQSRYYSPLILRLHMPSGIPYIERYFKFVAHLENDYQEQQGLEIEMDLCQNLVSQDSDEYYLYSDNDQCLDGKVAEQIVQNIDQKQSIYMYLVITPCTQDYNGFRCAMTDSGVADKQAFYKSLLENEQFSVQLSFNYLELDEQSGMMTLKTQDYQLFLDPFQTQVMYVEFQRTITEVDTGLLLPQINQYSFISNLKIFSIFVTKEFLKDYYDFKPELRDSYLTIKFSLSRTDNIEKVVFEKFSTPLAQFFSILNVLMAIGIFSVFVSEAKIFESIMLIYMKVYYKQTALNLAQYKKDKKEEKSQKTNNEAQKNCQIPQIDSIIPENDSILKLGPIQSFLLFKSAETKAEKLQKDQETVLKGLSEDEKIYLKLFDSVQNNQTFTNIFTEMLTHKNAIQLLLTPQQYAALNFVGRDFDKILDDQQIQNLNHLEQMDKIDRDPLYKSKLVQELVQNGKKGIFYQPLDKILYNCLIQQAKDFDLNHQISDLENLKNIIQKQENL